MTRTSAVSGQQHGCSLIPEEDREVEERIEELTSFTSGKAFHTRLEGE
jgi:hypothetical protein